MFLFKCLLVVYTAAIIFVTVYGQATGPDENCLGCVCEGSTSCNVSTACNVPYAGAYFCGPFLISYAYWSDAGKPVLGSDDPNRRGAFEACTLDLQCAAETVKKYMEKFGQDCNDDGIIDCEDYVRIHGLGGYGCKDPSFVNSEFYKRYAKCFKVIKDASVPNASIRDTPAQDTPANDISELGASENETPAQDTLIIIEEV